MSTTGKITVVTVVKNDAVRFEETIRNVIEKKIKNDIDYIVVDGGSTDGTLDIINKYADQLSYWVSEPDSGIYEAMNKGWAAAADGSFILFLGAGDLLKSLPGNVAGYSVNDVVYGSVQMGEARVFRSRADFHLKLYNALHHQALLINKALHPDPPFNCRYRIYADFDFNQRLKIRGANFVYSPEFMAFARPGGVSDRQYFPETLKIISANFGFLWSSLAFSGYYAMMFFPFLKRLRPF